MTKSGGRRGAPPMPRPNAPPGPPSRVKSGADDQQRERLAATIESALQSRASALIVMAELRPVLAEVVRVLREKESSNGKHLAQS